MREREREKVLLCRDGPCKFSPLLAHTRATSGEKIVRERERGSFSHAQFIVARERKKIDGGQQKTTTDR